MQSVASGLKAKDISLRGNKSFMSYADIGRHIQ